MSNRSTAQDPVAATILRSKLEAIVAEMEAILVNTAYSPNVSVSRQCAAAIVSEHGEIVAVSSALHLYPLAFTAALIVEQYQFNLSGEDILLTNDPYGGGTGVRNFTSVAPVSDGETIALYVAVCAQTEDFGGDLRGNLHPSAIEIWAEGARCPPMKITREARPQRDVLKTLALNSRNPDAFELDVQAMVAAINVGRQRLRELLDRQGRTDLVASIETGLDYSERRMRTLLDSVPTGTYSGEHALEHDGQGGRGAVVKVQLRFDERGVEVDFTGTSPQTTSFVNSTQSAAATCVFLPLIAALRGQIPFNGGALRAIRLVMPGGTLVNPRLPAPTGWGDQHVGHEIATAVTIALAKAVPQQAGRVTANSVLLFLTRREARHGQTLEQVETFDLSNFAQSGADGSNECDGWGVPGATARRPLPSIELYEADRGGRIESLEFIPDSAGAGQLRGGPGTAAVISLPRVDGGIMQITSVVLKGRDLERQNSVALEGGGESTEIESVAVNRPIGDLVKVSLAMEGGRGWGSPFERRPAAVIRDVLDGIISTRAAGEVYGVILDASGAIDEAATRRRRAELTRSTSGRGQQGHG